VEPQKKLGDWPGSIVGFRSARAFPCVERQPPLLMKTRARLRDPFRVRSGRARNRAVPGCRAANPRALASQVHEIAVMSIRALVYNSMVALADVDMSIFRDRALCVCDPHDRSSPSVDHAPWVDARWKAQPDERHSRYYIAHDHSTGDIAFQNTYGKRKVIGIGDYLQYLCHIVPPIGSQVVRIVRRRIHFRSANGARREVHHEGAKSAKIRGRTLSKPIDHLLFPTRRFQQAGPGARSTLSTTPTTSSAICSNLSFSCSLPFAFATVALFAVKTRLHSIQCAHHGQCEIRIRHRR
jgi:hypothetical protein